MRGSEFPTIGFEVCWENILLSFLLRKIVATVLVLSELVFCFMLNCSFHGLSPGILLSGSQPALISFVMSQQKHDRFIIIGFLFWLYCICTVMLRLRCHVV